MTTNPPQIQSFPIVRGQFTFSGLGYTPLMASYGMFNKDSGTGRMGAVLANTREECLEAERAITSEWYPGEPAVRRVFVAPIENLVWAPADKNPAIRAYIALMAACNKRGIKVSEHNPEQALCDLITDIVENPR